MKIHTAEYIISAPSLKECPDFGNQPEFVLVGRSNVGKSSFINSLTQRKNLARTSNTPGKTRYINFYKVTFSGTAKKPAAVGAGQAQTPNPPASAKTREVIFVDLPGYGYAKVSKTEQEKWRKNLEAYLTQRKTIRRVIQLMDARHGAQDNDIRMYEWLQFSGLPTQVVLTKSDKLSRNEMAKEVAQSARALDIAPSDIMLYSAETHFTRDAAWALLDEDMRTAPPPRD